MTDKPRRTNPGTEISQQIDRYRTSITTVLPSHIDPAMFVRVAQGVVRRDTKLADAAQRNLPSFMSALMECARLGLEPGETYHLIPFEDTKNKTVEVQGVVDYKGEIELIYRAGAAASVVAELVHANDRFAYQPGADRTPEHQVDWFQPRGELVGVYAYAEMTNGAISKVVIMSAADIEKIKAEARGTNRASSPWNKWPERMWLKSAVHQLYNWVPSSPEYMTELLRARAAATPAAGGTISRTSDTPAIGETGAHHTGHLDPTVTVDAYGEQVATVAELTPSTDIDWVDLVDPETGEVINTRPEEIEEHA